MTHTTYDAQFNSPASAAPRRSRTLLKVGIAVMVAAVIAMAFLIPGLISAAGNPYGESAQQLPANRYGTFQVANAGIHHVYVEQIGAAPTTPDLVLGTPEGQRITPRSGAEESYNLNTRFGKRIADFDAAAPGKYRIITANAPAGSRIVITQVSVAGSIAGIAARGVGVLGAGFLMLVGIVLTIVGAVRSRQPKPVVSYGIPSQRHDILGQPHATPGLDPAAPNRAYANTTRFTVN
jgi:hypothetical protein